MHISQNFEISKLPIDTILDLLMRNPFFSIRGGRSFVVATKTHLLIQGGVQIDLVTVFDAILTNRQTCEKLQCVYENLMSNNFRKTAVPKKKNDL